MTGGDPPHASLVKPLVFGGIDGLTTTLAMVWSSTGAGEQLVSASAVLVLGIANLLATAVSMGVGDYVGTLAEYEAKLSADAADAGPPLLPAGGGTASGAHAAARQAAAVRLVRVAAIRSGLTMFVSFILFGGAPLLVYTPLMPMGIEARRVASTMLCFVSFFLLGMARARMTGGSVWGLSINMALLGSASALVSYMASKVIYAVVVGGDPPPNTSG